MLCVLFFLGLLFVNEASQTFDKTHANTIQVDNHPILQSLKSYHLFVPQQYSDFHLSIVKKGLRTHYSNTTGIHFKQLYFSFEYHDQHYIVDLSLNYNLFPSTFSIASFNKRGERQVHKPLIHELNHCYYQGQVRNIVDSQVVLSTCNGLRGFISLPDEFFIIEPLTTDVSSPAVDHHVMYKLSDLKENDVSNKCGNEEAIPNPITLKKQMNSFSESIRSHGRFRRAAAERKFVELVMVADLNEAQLYSDRVILENRIKEIVNLLDGFYQKLNIRIVLSHVEVWNHTNRISASTNPQVVLDEFLAYRLNERRNAGSDETSPWVHADNYHLLFGGDFDGGTVGMATVASMCGDRSGGVNQGVSFFEMLLIGGDASTGQERYSHGFTDGSRSNVVSIAAIVAHELGHNFGMGHDTSDCLCQRNADCVMAPSLGLRDVKDWSNCSAAYLEENLRLGLGSCLLNIPDPTSVYGGPECGNEILEQGEECDCGTPENCLRDRQKCCNPSTCKLQPTAKCDIGLCCEDCQYRSAGSVCRAAETECGLSEYCTGTSPYCPGNSYKLNGSPCSGNSICFDGVCMSHDMQCVSVWGQDAVSGPDVCYTRINAIGDENGNCGLASNGKFRNCSTENAKCGKLVCQSSSRRPIIGRDRVVYRSTVSSDGITHICKTIASTASDRDATEIGLVRTGTKCGDGKFCQDGSCNSIPELSMSCDDKCHGRGVCNNIYNCHCDSGWAPPYCATAGNGGSINSGPITDNNVDIQTVLLIVLMAVILPLIVILSTVIWYRYCGGRVQIQVWKKNREKRLQLVAIRKGKIPKVSTEARSSSIDNLVEGSPAVTFKTSADRSHKYLVTTETPNGLKLNTPSRPPPPTKSPSRLPPPTRPHYAPIAVNSPPARKAPPPPKATNTTTKPARPPPRPALPPNAWSGGEPLRSTGQAAPSISVEERRKQFNKM